MTTSTVGKTRTLSPLLPVITCIMAGFAGGATLVWVDGPSHAARRAACAHWVGVLVETRDRLEFDRASFLVGEMQCRVRRHLPRDQP